MTTVLPNCQYFRRDLINDLIMNGYSSVVDVLESVHNFGWQLLACFLFLLMISALADVFHVRNDRRR